MSGNDPSPSLSSPAPPAIEATGLTKAYGGLVALVPATPAAGAFRACKEAV